MEHPMISDQDLPEGHMLRGRPDIIMLMGLIITIWDRSEQQVRFLLEWLLEGDFIKARVIFYSATDNLARYKMIREFLNQERRYPDEVAKIKKLMNEWEDLCTERNYVIHGEWMFYGKDRELTRLAGARDLLVAIEDKNLKQKSYTAADLESLFHRIEDWSLRMNSILGPITLAENRKRRAPSGPPASPEKP
jgi:hypothetical protein